MDFTALQTELFARGFEYLNDAGTGLTRAKRWINDAYQEINRAADWPFLEASTSGTAPVTVSDLRKVISVHDATNRVPLQPTTRKWLLTHFGDLASTSGVPRFYYVDNGVVKAYPVSGTLSVYYLKVPTDLSAGADTPIFPANFHDIIIDGAVRRGYEDQDAWQSAQAVEQSRLARVDNMRMLLLTQSAVPSIGDEAEAGIVQPVVEGK